MSTIQELEQKVEQLERDILAEKQNTDLLKEKANKAIEYAQHAYKVDHYGIIWEWDTEAEGYRKTNMRIISPTVADRALESKHIADNAIEGRHLQDNVIEGRMIKNKTIDGRSLQDDIIGPDLILDNSIPGDRYINNAFIPGKLADNSVATRNIQPKAVVASKLAELAVTTEKVAEQAITTGKIHDLAVITEKIAELAVTTGKIADLAVTTEKLADGAVTNEKIHDLTISWLKLDTDLQNIIASREEGGVALSNEWGNSTLIGLTQKMLSEALGNVHKDGEEFVSLQQQIDEIVSGGATVNLVVTPSVIFANTTTDITLTASASKNASSINITGGELSEPITGSGTQVSGTDQNVNLPVGTLTYLATFIISGLQRTDSRTVSIANKIYYGAGQSDAVLNTEAMVFHTPAVAQPSFTQVINTALNDYIYFEVPSEMNNITKLELYDDPSFPTELAIESVATSRAGYKAYKTVNSRLAGTHTYKIS